MAWELKRREKVKRKRKKGRERERKIKKKIRIKETRRRERYKEIAWILFILIYLFTLLRDRIKRLGKIMVKQNTNKN